MILSPAGWHLRCIAPRGTEICPSEIRATENCMTWDDITRRWPQLKGQVKAEFSKLDDDAFDAIGGDRERLIRELEARYGYEHDHAVRRTDAWAARLHLESERSANP